MKRYVINLIFLGIVSGTINGQALKYGYIKEGVIDMYMEDPAEEDEAAKEELLEIMNNEYTKEVYFSPEIQVVVQKRPNLELRTYYTDSRNVLYRVLESQEETVYCIDSSYIEKSEDERFRSRRDSIRIIFEQQELTSEKTTYLGFDCSVLTLEEPDNKVTTFFLTRSIEAEFYGGEWAFGLTGYPIKIEFEFDPASFPGLFFIYGATEIYPINSDDDIFNLDLTNIKRVSTSEMSGKAGRLILF